MSSTIFSFLLISGKKIVFILSQIAKKKDRPDLLNSGTVEEDC
jgi:hypothetical protein